jgi:hypothetical protein
MPFLNDVYIFLDGMARGLNPAGNKALGSARIQWDGTNLSSAAGLPTFTSIGINCRDAWGVDDGHLVITRPFAVLDLEHEYNLKNQGWDTTRITHFNTGSGGANLYPANTDIQQLGKDESTYPAGYGSAVNFYNAIIDTNWGWTPAPKGRVVVQAEDMLTLRRNVVASVLGYHDQYVPTHATTFAGRAWYGFNRSSYIDNGGLVDDLQPDFQDIIGFSQIASTDWQVRACLMEADPTSEEFNEVVASDGGTIDIPQLNGCIGMEVFGRHLIVFGRGGTWAISGPSDGIFTATSFEVNKVSDIVAAGKGSIVRTGFGIVFWAKDGIYYVLPVQATGQPVVRNVSKETIQGWYDDIPQLNKRFAEGYFQSLANKVRWLYSTTHDVGTENQSRFDRELIFDLDTGAFTRHAFQEIAGSTSAYLCGYMPEYNPDSTTDPIYLVADVVGGVATQNGMTFAQLNDVTFKDYFTIDSTGVNFDSYVETGQYTGGDTQRDKQIPYLTMHFLRTELNVVGTDPNFTLEYESACDMISKWEFSDHVDSGKESEPKNFYRLSKQVAVDTAGPYDYGHEIITTKDSVRGSGNVVRFRFQSQDGKDFQIVGWGFEMTGQTDV